MVVWSNQAVDKITVPASVPIGGAQDGVIISGADIPVELKTIGITAAVIFQRGNYPSMGVKPEAKYFFMGISNAVDLVNRGVLTMGAVVDDKAGGLQVVSQFDFPVEYYKNALGLWTGKYGDSPRYMDIHFGQGNHITEGAIQAVNQTAKAGQTLTTQGWYNLTLNAGWVPLGAPGWTSGVEWKATSSGVILLRGGLNCTLASSGGSVICNLGINDLFKTFPNAYHAFLAPWDNATSSGVCKMKVSSTGDVIIDTPLSPPPSPSNLTFSTDFYGYQ